MIGQMFAALKRSQCFVTAKKVRAGSGPTTERASANDRGQDVGVLKIGRRILGPERDGRLQETSFAVPLCALPVRLSHTHTDSLDVLASSDQPLLNNGAAWHTGGAFLDVGSRVEPSPSSTFRTAPLPS